MIFIRDINLNVMIFKCHNYKIQHYLNITLLKNNMQKYIILLKKFAAVLI